MAQGVEASWVGDWPKGGSAYTTNSIRGLLPRPQQVTPPSSTLTPIPLSSSGHKQQAGLHAGVTSVSQAGASQASAALPSQAGVYHAQKAVVPAVSYKMNVEKCGRYRSHQQRMVKNDVYFMVIR